MTFQRLAAIALIFVGASIARSVLDRRFSREPDSSTAAWSARSSFFGARRIVRLRRTPDSTSRRRHRAVGAAPNGCVVRTTVSKPVLRLAPAALESTRATVDLDLQHRQKGLLCTPRTVSFSFTFRNPDSGSRAIRAFPLPAQNALLDDFVFSVDGKTMSPGSDVSKKSTLCERRARRAVTLNVQYRSRGLNMDLRARRGGAAQVRDFNLAMHQLPGHQLPAGTMSPGDKAQHPVAGR